MTATTSGYAPIADREPTQGVSLESEKASKPVTVKKPVQAPVQDTIASWTSIESGWHAGHLG